MNGFGLLYLLLTEYLCGSAILQLFKNDLKPVYSFCLSMMLGVALFSFAPCVLQLLNVPITMLSVLLTTAIMTGICSIALFKSGNPFKKFSLRRPELFELPFVLVITAFAALSAWRCFYYPPYARDVLSGGEVIAEYTVRERTMINSVFSVDLHTTNNYLKSPFLTALQVVYKLLVTPFGQLWLSTLFVSFTIFIYVILKERVHAVIAGFLSLLFMVTPDLYAYSYMILYDYSNMVFFFCGSYFMMRSLQAKSNKDMALAALLLGIATYIRTETLVLVVLLSPMLFIIRRLPARQAAKQVGILLGTSALFYVICIHVFVRSFVPIHFNEMNSVNPHLADVTPIFSRLWEMFRDLIFSQTGINVYGYFIFFFFAILLSDLGWTRTFSREAKATLYCIAVVFVGLALVGYLIPMADVANTTKRGLFKALPLMLLYMANSATVQRLSSAINRWEAEPKLDPAKEKETMLSSDQA